MTASPATPEDLAGATEAALGPLDEDKRQHDEKFQAEQAAAQERAEREFVITKQHRRFAEFCDAVRRERYIGLCYGPPGVGKTLSARSYSRWDTIGPALDQVRLREARAPTIAGNTRTVFYTPTVHNTPRAIEQDARELHHALGWAIDRTLHPDQDLNNLVRHRDDHTELTIIDETDRLKNPSSTAASGSCTTTNPSPPTNRPVYSPTAGPTSTSTTPRTSPPPKPAPPSSASPTATSASPPD